MSDTLEPTLALVRPSMEYAASFTEMAAEFQRAGEHRYVKDMELIRGNFPAYLKQIERLSHPEGHPPGRVPQSEFWLVNPEERCVLGAIRLRNGLTPRLRLIDGQIGYNIRPGARGRGYATRMLAMLLDQMRGSGWERVLVTCNSDNIASARVIEKNGGQLENQELEAETGKMISRYWIILRPDSEAPGGLPR